MTVAAVPPGRSQTAGAAGAAVADPRRGGGGQRGQGAVPGEHEPRAAPPLYAIGGYVQLLALEIYGPVGEAQRGALARIQKSQRHLLGLINEVLNYAKVDAGAVAYALQPVRVAEAVSRTGATGCRGAST